MPAACFTKFELETQEGVVAACNPAVRQRQEITQSKTVHQTSSKEEWETLSQYIIWSVTRKTPRATSGHIASCVSTLHTQIYTQSYSKSTNRIQVVQSYEKGFPTIDKGGGRRWATGGPWTPASPGPVILCQVHWCRVKIWACWFSLQWLSSVPHTLTCESGPTSTSS